MHSEMVRLSTKLLQPKPPLQHDNHVTISMFNTRSITAKLPDIVKDDGLSSN